MMNFRSLKAYRAWLAYGHLHGLFKKTLGHQAISIKGKKRVVQH